MFEDWYKSYKKCSNCYYHDSQNDYCLLHDIKTHKVFVCPDWADEESEHDGSTDMTKKGANMTKEEAIKKLEDHMHWHQDEYIDFTGTVEALGMAIEALKEQRPPLEISKTVNREEFENIIKNCQMMLITPNTEKIELIREQQWIPCSEKLPEKNGRYWVWADKEFIQDNVGLPKSYRGSTEASFLDGRWYGDSIGEVYAWMQLPSAYIEERAV